MSFLSYDHDFCFQLPDWYSPLYFSAIIMMYTNSAINPVLYGGLNENFRNGFRDLINAILNRKSHSHKALLNALWTSNRSRVVVDELGTKPGMDHLQVPTVAMSYINPSVDVSGEEPSRTADRATRQCSNSSGT